jgi:transmembrane sensor
VGDLLKFADEERKRGNLRGAIEALRAVVDGDPSESRRAIAAFTLGKLLLDGENRPAQAKLAFRACLRLSPPAAVAEDALARLVEAEARGGAASAARAAALDYERRYPKGRRLADVRRWANIR